MMPERYVAVDGDDIGNRLEYLMLTNKLDELAVFSKSFDQSFGWLGGCFANELQANVIFVGGDNLLAIVVSTDSLLDRLDALRHNFAEQTGHSLSIGVGGSARQAYIALKLAKVSGKNCICVYKEEDDG